MPWGAAIGAVGGLLGGSLANDSAEEQSEINAQTTENASARQLEMQRRSMEELQRQFELARRDTLAGRATGVGAMNFLNQALLPQGYGSFVDPSIVHTPENLQARLYDQEGNVDPTRELNTEPDYLRSAFTDPAYSFELSLDPEASFRRSLEPIFGEPYEPLRFNEYTPDAGTPFESTTDQYTTQERPALGPSVDGQSYSTNAFLPGQFDPGEFEADPGYAFRVSEGEKGMQNQLAASGLNASGRALKEMERFRQNQGSQEYGNFFNRRLSQYQQGEQDKQNYLGRIFQMAGYGPQSVNTSVGAGQTTGGNVANVNANTANALSNITMQGGANAANIAGQRTANINNAIQGGLSNYQSYRQQQNMNNLFNQPQYQNTAYNPYDDPSSLEYNEWQ